MSKSFWLLGTMLAGVALPAQAQVATEGGTPGPTEQGGGVAATPAVVDAATDNGDIIVTATRRNEALSDVPIAVSAVSGDTLTRSGATDIRALNQLSPSLLVSSTTSDAGGAVARIRGIGTVGDNPGLESSVALFIDGVYRSRTGVGLTELGAIDRIEVLRGPQGTLFGRNASAGLISVITAKPSYEEAGTAELSYGNYDYWRGQLGLTGAIVPGKIAYRLDGVYVKRDGFLKEGPYSGSTGRRFNDRDRYIVRGQLLFEPTEALSFRLIGDYSRKNEECCAGVYLPTRDVSRNASGQLVTGPSSTAAVLRSLGGFINDRPYDRRASVSPGRSYRQDVEDYGLSGEVNYDLGGAALTSITAYRNNDYTRGQDADFSSVDLLYRPDDGRDFIRFRTFTQELRLQGEAFAGKLDWLVGGYYASEKLDVRSALSFGKDFDSYITRQVQLGGGGAQFPGFSNLRGFLSAGLAQGGLPTALIGQIAPLVPNIATYSNTGQDDRYRQRSRNFAFFTHNVIHVTDTLSLTLGARYTNERKTLNANFTSTVPAGNATAQLGNAIVALRTLAANAPATAAGAALRAGATQAANGITALAPASALYGVLTGFNGTLPERRRKEDEWTGTAVLSWKPTPDLLTYASYSKGYKAGGFNLDRSVLSLTAPDLNQLEFQSEKVDAYELGAKFNGRGFDLNVALFQQEFKNFQLNNFQGVNFIVENINGCTALAGGSGADSDTGNSGSAAEAAATASGACTGKLKPGVRSRGIEVEAYIRPAPDFNVNIGFTRAETKYKKDLAGAFGRPLPTSLVNLPGARVSNSAVYTVTTGAGWTPALGTGGLRGLIYADMRYQSDINTGSDLFFEKRQDGFVTVNARVGLTGEDGAWALEFWGQNIFDTDYTQVAFNAPTQGLGDTISVARGLQTSTNRLYGAFLAEPRTYGVTVRTKF
ncbi:TonB-dependent receptor [Sphingomonas solaris]|uniref:TonB-dependent receptor n=1 Tax=Alterirhizorhabdus solaris TaxID=2529389 RepID=A0A558R948_9SPHN|nr:TonB-dependent receptor [Sphingomonas solaris]TVV75812.1 TonB-dependent receptor [Sphingomonas solaris]